MIPKALYNILIELLPMVILFTVVMVLYRLICYFYAKEKIVLYRDLKYLVYIIYMFILFALVTSTDFESYSNNFIPFKEIMRYKVTSVLFYRNVIGNIALFMPVGYLVTDVIKEKSKKVNIFITLISSLIISATIEVIQMFIGRSFDIDDIILNFLGSLLGYIIFRIMHLISNKLPDKLNNNIIKLLFTLLIIGIFILVILFSYGVL